MFRFAAADAKKLIPWSVFPWTPSRFGASSLWMQRLSRPISASKSWRNTSQSWEHIRRGTCNVHFTVPHTGLVIPWKLAGWL